MDKLEEIQRRNGTNKELENKSSEFEADTLAIEKAQSPEGTIGEAKKARRNLLGRIVKSKTADLAGNIIPGVDIPKMVAESLRGITTSGEVLSNEKRFSYLAISGVTALPYALAAGGATGEAAVTRSLAAGLSSTEFGPEVLKMMATTIQASNPKAARFVYTTAEYFREKKDAFINAGANMMLAINRTM